MKITILHTYDMHFLGSNDKERARDFCVHGKISFVIDGVQLSDDSDWCVSASAFRFLHSLTENHLSGNEDFLIPHCGHFMIPSDDGKTVHISGCLHGIDFDVVHKDGTVQIQSNDGANYTVPFKAYKEAVIDFANQVMNFYKENSARSFENDYDRRCFSAYITEWYSLYNEAVNTTASEIVDKDDYFKDYDAISEKSIIAINDSGIALNPFGFIDFKECSDVFFKYYGKGIKCIGERDITGYSYTFYALPKPIMIKFINRGKLVEFFSKENTVKRFHRLQKSIVEFGYCTYDMS